jgi:hypothetical protein
MGEEVKLALIAPTAMLTTCQITDYQLALAHVAMHDEQYMLDYQWFATAGHHVILDNGAAEGSLVGTDQLLDVALRMKPTEIVIPDTLGDFAATIQQAKEFATHIVGHMAQQPFQYLFVAQGQNIDEFKNAISWAQGQPWITRVAIPKHTLATTSDINARLKLLEWSATQFGTKPIHCIGANKVWPAEMQDLADQGIAASIDTALPYVAGFAGVDLFDVAGGFDVTRQEHYFGLDPDADQFAMIMHNIDVVVGWCES